MAQALRNEGGLKCQPFLANRVTIRNGHYQGKTGCFQFLEAVVTSTAKESLRSTECGSQ